MPGTAQVGVSRKIEDEEERQRLKQILKACKLPESVGLIVRTVLRKFHQNYGHFEKIYLARLSIEEVILWKP